jgi:hypothetical protein
MMELALHKNDTPRPKGGASLKRKILFLAYIPVQRTGYYANLYKVI